MASSFVTIISKFARKLAMALLIGVLSWLAVALWLYLHESAGYEIYVAERTRSLELQQAAAVKEWSEADAKTETAITVLAARRQRLAQIDKVVAGLHDQEPGALGRLFGDRDQRAINENRLAGVLKLRDETLARIEESQRDVLLGEQSRTSLQLKMDAIKAELEATRHDENALLHYLRVAWTEFRWVVCSFVLLYLFGGLAVAFALYFGWARFVSKGSPLRLRDDDVPPPSVGESAQTVEHFLWPGERLWVKPEFLQSADPALARGSRLLPDWKRPLSWLLCGNSGLVELRNGSSAGERPLVLAGKAGTFSELAVVAVPEGGSFVIRAGFVRGMVADIVRRPLIRRHWRWLAWQSWVSGQFGYMEFFGRCRLIVSGATRLEAETLAPTRGGAPAAVRTPLAGLVGFSPQLALKPVRTEGFWRHFGRKTPLFDLSVGGPGVFISRGVGGRGRDGPGARFLKLFGL